MIMAWFDKKPIITLAPMADMTDSPFCRICREVTPLSGVIPSTSSGQALSETKDPSRTKRDSSASLQNDNNRPFVIFREMVSSEAIVRNNAKTLKMCAFDEVERPIVLQIFGGNPAVMREAARIIVDKYHPEGIDINMGCPVPKITGKVAAGAALMKNHDVAVKIVKELKNEKLGAPISVKTRLGWSDPKEILEFAPKLEAAGADAITIHGRTKTQGYSGKANWEMIGEAKKRVSIPVIANGDIKNSEDIKRCLDTTRADGIMIGRGALGNPWIFRYVIPSEAQRSRGTPFAQGLRDPSASLRFAQDDKITSDELIEVVLRHAKYHIERYGEKSMVTFRKHLAWYFTNRKIFNIKELRKKLVQIRTMAELEEILKNITIL